MNTSEFVNHTAVMLRDQGTVEFNGETLHKTMIIGAILTKEPLVTEREIDILWHGCLDLSSGRRWYSNHLWDRRADQILTNPHWADINYYWHSSISDIPGTDRSESKK